MRSSVRARALFERVRGKPPADEEELVELLLRLSQLLSDHPEIVELDLNPFLAGIVAREVAFSICGCASWVRREGAEEVGRGGVL